MKSLCCACKHICCNPEYDEMLDCEIAPEETGLPHCCTNDKFDKFELETDPKIVQSYLKAYQEEYGRTYSPGIPLKENADGTFNLV